MDAKYMKKVKPFLERMAKELKPMLISNGGNILAVQIENEYVSYGIDDMSFEYSFAHRGDSRPAARKNK